MNNGLCANYVNVVEVLILMHTLYNHCYLHIYDYLQFILRDFLLFIFFSLVFFHLVLYSFHFLSSAWMSKKENMLLKLPTSIHAYACGCLVYRYSVTMLKKEARKLRFNIWLAFALKMCHENIFL